MGCKTKVADRTPGSATPATGDDHRLVLQSGGVLTGGPGDKLCLEREAPAERPGFSGMLLEQFGHHTGVNLLRSASFEGQVDPGDRGAQGGCGEPGYTVFAC